MNVNNIHFVVKDLNLLINKKNKKIYIYHIVYKVVMVQQVMNYQSIIKNNHQKENYKIFQ